MENITARYANQVILMRIMFVKNLNFESWKVVKLSMLKTNNNVLFVIMAGLWIRKASV